MSERLVSHGKLSTKIINKVVGPVTAAVLAFSPVATEFSQVPTPIPESIPLSATNSEHFYRNNLVLNGDGLPVGYMSVDGAMNIFNSDKVKELKQEAISSGEPQILAMFSSKDQLNSETYNTANSSKGIINKPEDVVSAEELAKKYGITIINAPNMEFGIRIGAFKAGGPFAELAGKGGSEKVTIVFVNGPVVAKGFMGDSIYNGVRDWLPNSYGNVEAYRLGKVNELKRQLEAWRKWGSAQTKAIGVQDEILRLKSLEYAYEKGIITDNQLLVQKWAEFSQHTGYYYDGGDLWQNLGLKKGGYSNRTIFVAVGRREALSKNVVYFDPNGQLLSKNLSVDDSGGHLDNSPNSSESYPNPRDFPLENASSPYIYAVRIAVWALEHEAEHDILTAQAANEGKKLNWIEGDTDMGAAIRLMNATDKLVESGDNSGFCFVLRLPDGTYIIF